MNEQDEKLMSQYGITADTKVLFHFDGYRYERLADAVNYAKTQQSQPSADNTSLHNHSS